MATSCPEPFSVQPFRCRCVWKSAIPLLPQSIAAALDHSSADKFLSLNHVFDSSQRRLVFSMVSQGHSSVMLFPDPFTCPASTSQIIPPPSLSLPSVLDRHHDGTSRRDANWWSRSQISRQLNTQFLCFPEILQPGYFLAHLVWLVPVLRAGPCTGIDIQHNFKPYTRQWYRVPGTYCLGMWSLTIEDIRAREKFGTGPRY